MWTLKVFPNLEVDDFRYRLLLNDGIYSNSFSMLATQVRFLASLLSQAITAVPVCKFSALKRLYFTPTFQLNYLIHDGAIPQFTIIKMKKFTCNQMANQVQDNGSFHQLTIYLLRASAWLSFSTSKSSRKVQWLARR